MPSQHEPQGEPPLEATAPDPAPLSSGLLDDLARFGRAFKQLFGAQLHLLGAELGLARSAVSWMLLAGLAATVAGVGLGLSVLALIGMLLAKWFGSWLWAMLVLCLLQVFFLLGAVVLFRRCMHWMSLPATRGEWGAMMRDTLRKADRRIEAGHGDKGAP
ncbi:MAG TPA: ABC transporter ATP-binding protein [Rhodanobacter sp.]